MTKMEFKTFSCEYIKFYFYFNKRFRHFFDSWYVNVLSSLHFQQNIPTVLNCLSSFCHINSISSSIIINILLHNSLLELHF